MADWWASSRCTDEDGVFMGSPAARWKCNTCDSDGVCAALHPYIRDSGGRRGVSSLGWERLIRQPLAPHIPAGSECQQIGQPSLSSSLLFSPSQITDWTAFFFGGGNQWCLQIDWPLLVTWNLNAFTLQLELRCVVFVCDCFWLRLHGPLGCVRCWRRRKDDFTSN